jgi:hypothetical protein
MWQDNDYKNPNPFKTASDAREREERERITKQKILLGEAILKKAEEAWIKIEEMNEKIKLTEDDMLKSSLRREKNLFAEQMEKYVSDGYDNVCNVVNSSDFMRCKVKFMQSVENDMDLMKKHYGHFNYRNPVTYEPENEQLLEVRSLYKDLKEKITQELVSKNVDEESIAKTWQYISKNCEKHEQKCKAHEAQVVKLQETVMSCGVWRYGTNPPKSFTDAKPLEDKLNQYHTVGLSNLKFNSDQLVKQSIAKGLELSGQLPEESLIILEIKSVSENLEEKINKSLADKNIEEEVKNQVWQMPFYSSKYKQVLDKLKTHEQWVRVYEDKILNCDTLSESNSLNIELKKMHKDVTEELNFHTNQAIKHFVTKALQISGKPLEETSMMLDIKNIHGGFKEKINKNFEDNLINEKVKSAVDNLFNPKCNQHLEKLKLIEKSVRQYEDQLLMCDNFQQSKIIIDSLNKKQKEIDNWKLDSNNLIEEIINKATELAYKELEVGNSEIDNSFKINNTTHSIFLNQQPLINPIEIDQSINSFVLGGASRLLEIKNLLSTFKEKLNTSLDENSNIHQKIKFDVCKIYHPKCKKHLEKLELIEKSIKKYEDLPNSQKTEKIINHLAKCYKKIDKWEVDSDDLIETITMKALELSYKIQPNLNEQNNLQVQKLMDEMTELKNTVKMNQNLMEIPPINQLHPDESSDSQDLNQSIKSISLSWEKIGKSNVEPNLAQELEAKLKLKIEKKRVEIKGEIKLIKIGIKKDFTEDELKEELKYTKNHFSEIKDFFKINNDLYIAKGNESDLVESLGNHGWISDSE